MFRTRHLQGLVFAMLAASAFAAAVALTPGVEPRPAYACSGGPGPFADEAKNVTAIAVVQVLAVGGAENAAPVLTPVPPSTPQGAPIGSSHPIPDLTGIGARLRVESVVAGQLSAEMNIDDAVRKGVEQRIRLVQSNPNTIMPCALDFTVQRYAMGDRYLLFLGQENGAYYTGLRYKLDGDRALIAGTEAGPGSYAMWVPEDVKDAYFGGLPAVEQGEWDGQKAYRITTNSVPLQTIIEAIRGLRAGGPAAGTRPGAISPPDTGDGGLR